MKRFIYAALGVAMIAIALWSTGPGSGRTVASNYEVSEFEAVGQQHPALQLGLTAIGVLAFGILSARIAAMTAARVR